MLQGKMVRWTMDTSNFYFNRLTESEKAAYRLLKTHIENYEAFPLRIDEAYNIDSEEVVHGLLMDVPQLVQFPLLSGITISTMSNGTAIIEASGYSCSRAEAEETLAKASAICMEMEHLRSDKDEQQRRLIVGVVKALRGKARYWLRKRQSISSESPKGVLLDCNAICTGFSRTVTLILRMLKLPVISVRCRIKAAYSLYGQDMAHMINAIWTNDGWVFFDPVSSMARTEDRSIIAKELLQGYHRKDYSDGDYYAPFFYNARTVQEKYKMWGNEKWE